MINGQELKTRLQSRKLSPWILKKNTSLHDNITIYHFLFEQRLTLLCDFVERQSPCLTVWSTSGCRVSSRFVYYFIISVHYCIYLLHTRLPTMLELNLSLVLRFRSLYNFYQWLHHIYTDKPWLKIFAFSSLCAIMGFRGCSWLFHTSKLLKFRTVGDNA